MFPPELDLFAPYERRQFDAAAQRSNHAVFRRIGQRDSLDGMRTRIFSKLGTRGGDDCAVWTDREVAPK